LMRGNRQNSGLGAETRPVGLGAAKPRICWGVRRGRRLVCGEPVADEGVIKEVLELINELRGRIEKHKDKLETAAFIDELIGLLERWLEEHKNDEGRKVKEAKKIARKMIKLLRRLRRRWVEEYWRQLMELLELLERNAIDVIVTGENNGEKSLAIHLYNKDVAVIVAKMAKSGSVTIRLSLSRSEGDDVKVANTFNDKELLKAIQHGWEMTDGSIMEGYPRMTTSQPWQVVLWSLAYPGEIHMLINGININEDGVSIKWYLVANDYRAGSKGEIAKEVERLGTERLRVFLAPAVWGDGEVNVGEKYVRLYMGLSKYDLWLGIIERLINELSFTIYPGEYKVEVKVLSSKAVGLARDWLSMQDVKELIELGAGLPGSEKLRRIIELASREVRELGSSSILIPGTSISMTIDVKGDCRVELRAWRRSEDETLSLVEELRRAGYEPSLRVARKYYEVAILHSEIQSKPELREPVCDYLRSRYMELPNDEIEGKWRYAKAIQNLKCLDND